MTGIEALLGRIAQRTADLVIAVGPSLPKGQLRSVRSLKRLKKILLVITLVLGLPSLFAPEAIAVEPPNEPSWWSQLLQAHNGTSFCLPPDTKDIDVARTLQGFIQANHLPETLTELQAVQLLAHIYPCAGRGLGNDRLKLKDVLGDPDFQQGVVGAAKQASVVTQNPCPSAKFSLTEKLEIYEPLRFDPSGVIVGGGWKQEVREQGCGTSRILNVLTDVKGPKNLSMTPLLPGTTQADPLLQKDAMQVAITAVGVVPTECKTLYVADTEFLDQEGSASEGVGGPAWRELWTLAFCTGRAQVPLRFVPDSKGTRIMIGTTASTVAPSPPQR